MNYRRRSPRNFAPNWPVRAGTSCPSRLSVPAKTKVRGFGSDLAVQARGVGDPACEDRVLLSIDICDSVRGTIIELPRHDGFRYVGAHDGDIIAANSGKGNCRSVGENRMRRKTFRATIAAATQSRGFKVRYELRLVAGSCGEEPQQHTPVKAADQERRRPTSVAPAWAGG